MNRYRITIFVDSELDEGVLALAADQMADDSSHLIGKVLDVRTDPVS